MGIPRLIGADSPNLTSGDDLETKASTDRVQWLEQQHVELIKELDLLNTRLEQTLSSFQKTASSPSELVGISGQAS